MNYKPTTKNTGSTIKPPASQDDERDAYEYIKHRAVVNAEMTAREMSAMNEGFLAGRRWMIHPQDADIRTSAFAQAYADAAVKAERERCAKIVHERHGNFGVKTANEILNPTEGNGQ